MPTAPGPEAGPGHAEVIFQAGLRAVQADHLVRQQLQVTMGGVSAGGCFFPLTEGSRICVVGAGKAVAHMAAALEGLEGISIDRGSVIAKYGHGLPLEKIALHEAGHPSPDAQGVTATAALTNVLQSLQPADLLIVLLTGGASALMADPPAGVPLEELALLTNALLKSGAPIQAINCVRKHLSTLKGGQLLLKAQPARVLTLVVSDVVGNPLDAIASGPTVADPTTYADALAVLAQHDISPRLAPAAYAHLQAGAGGAHPETWKGSAAGLADHATVLLGHNGVALNQALHRATLLGYETRSLGADWQGHAEDVAQQLLTEIRKHAAQGRPPLCLAAAGELTLRVTGTGTGGRAQHLALLMQHLRRPHERWTFLAAGTDGTDGPTTAAGAVVSPGLAERAEAAGLQAAQYLADYNSYVYFSQAGGHIVTGPTGTNVMDLYLALVY